MNTREELDQDIKSRCELLKQNFDSDLMKHGVDLGFINASYDLVPLIENLQRQNTVMREALTRLGIYRKVEEQDHNEWGNADDSFNHGFDLAKSNAAYNSREAITQADLIAKELETK